MSSFLKCVCTLVYTIKLLSVEFMHFKTIVFYLVKYRFLVKILKMYLYLIITRLESHFLLVKTQVVVVVVNNKTNYMQANNLINFNTHFKMYFPCSKIFQFIENHFLTNIVI